MNRAYLVMSLLCGTVWGGIAYVLGFSSVPREQLVAGVVASPIIGLLVGILSSPTYSLHWGVRLLAPPVLLYLSAAFFALAMSIRGRTEADLVENLGGVLLGTTFNLVLLLPLAYGTHYGLAAFRSTKPKPH
jgi:hypothetical protein